VCGDRHEGSGRHLLECVLDRVGHVSAAGAHANGGADAYSGAAPKGISILDLGTPVSGVAANNATTTVALKLSTGTGAPTATSSIVIPAGALPAAPL